VFGRFGDPSVFGLEPIKDGIGVGEAAGGGVGKATFDGRVEFGAFAPVFRQGAARSHVEASPTSYKLRRFTLAR
jgi:hypothetical protein